jgi:hypothetical protein
VSLAEDLERLDKAYDAEYSEATLNDLLGGFADHSKAIIAALREQEAWARIEAALPGWLEDYQAPPPRSIAILGLDTDSVSKWRVTQGLAGVVVRSERGPTRLAALTALADALEARR